jgi:tRNA A37 threonylcarbamoyltransferase TsaD
MLVANWYRRVLAIETSCDDTSLAIVAQTWWLIVVEQMFKVSQDDIHAYFGWVVPELAYRSHATQLLILLKKIWIDYCKQSCDAIAVTAYPWLPWSLLIWRACAHFLWLLLQKPVVEVHHIYGHIFSVLCDRPLSSITLPYVCMTVSGWHNDVYLVVETTEANHYLTKLSFHEDASKSFQAQNPQSPSNATNDLSPSNATNNQLATNQLSPSASPRIHTKWSHQTRGSAHQLWPYTIIKVWQTLDDAAGEAFDKVARMLWWPYPWWARLWTIAELGKDLFHPEAEDVFRVSHAKLPEYCVSFSWLKSQLVYTLQKKPSLKDDQKRVYRIAYLFQETVVKTLSSLLDTAIKDFSPSTLWVCGWVAANLRLRETILTAHPTTLFPVSGSYCTDNAWMIWVVGLLD